MGIAAYNRGTRAIIAQLDREQSDRYRKPCPGKYENGPGKRFARCARCRHVNYEANEGDRCIAVIVEVR